MVPKIPIGAREVADIWTDADQSASGAQTAVNLDESAAQIVLAAKVFEEVAGEHAIETVIRQLPWLRAILFQELNVIGRVFFRVRIQVHPVFFPGYDIVNELAPAAAQIEQLGVRGDESLKKLRRQDFPNGIAISALFSETHLILETQFPF